MTICSGRMSKPSNPPSSMGTNVICKPPSAAFGSLLFSLKITFTIRLLPDCYIPLLASFTKRH